MTRVNAYYNEIDEYAARWLRNLIAAGHIAPGLVDERSIKDVRPQDLTGFTQCHFFAGIGVWSYALRLAGWPDDRPVWTGSCPCQPFSAAGKGKGFADERHLWPEFHRLISECQPGVVFGEQVASKDGLAWLDTVCADMEGAGYAIGAVDLCAAGCGAPHIRQRLWFAAERLADDDEQQWNRSRNAGPRRRDEFTDGSATRWMGDDDDAGLEGQRRGHQAESGRLGAARPVAAAGEPRGLADPQHAVGWPLCIDREDGYNGANGGREETHGFTGTRGKVRGLADADVYGRGEAGERLTASGGYGLVGDGAASGPGPTNGFWRDADWLYCRDGKWRPVGPGAFPLAHGAPARVGRLRAYGNAIVAQAAAEVISAFMECRP